MINTETINDIKEIQNITIDWLSILTGEMLLFGLLAKIIYSEPDEEWLAPLLQGELFSEAPLGMEQEHTRSGLNALNRWITEKNRELEDNRAIDDLKSDYLTLFIGPGLMKAPLWESVYFNDKNLLFQEQTMDVRRCYASFGVEAERINHEPDDHIALELSFMSHLASLAIKVFGENSEEFERLLDAQREFLQQHLLQWGQEWALLVVEHARTDFYRGIGYLTLGSLMAAAQVLNVPLPVEELG